MKRWTGLVALAVFAVVIASPAQAQAQEKKQVQGYIAGGYVMPEGLAGDYLNGGWNLSGGAIFRPAPARPFGIRADLGYSYNGANTSALDIAQSVGLRVDDGCMSIWNLTAEAMWEFGSPDHVGGFVAVGLGGYRRYLQLANSVIVPGWVCDPWWGWCYPGGAPRRRHCSE